MAVTHRGGDDGVISRILRLKKGRKRFLKSAHDRPLECVNPKFSCAIQEFPRKFRKKLQFRVRPSAQCF